MSKLVPFLFAGTGAAAISVGGVYLVKNSGSSSGSTTTPENGNAAAQNTSTPEFLFETVDEFKNNYATKNKCRTDYFDGLSLNPETANTQTLSPTNKAETFFGGADDTTPYKSCLLVNWRKTTYSGDEGKWNGKFAWLWTFVKGDKGFINFNLAETDSTEGTKLKFTGIFYLLEKEGTTWSTKHKLEIGADKKVDSTQLDAHFPKRGTAVTAGDVDDYWGFVTEAGNLSKMCFGESCGAGTQQPPVIKMLSWTGSNSGDKKLQDWSADLNWWNSLYQDTNWNLGSKIGGFKGTWTGPNQ